MRSLGQFVTLLLLLFLSGAPAMACMVPDAPMSEQERACCRMMQGDCSDMQMPSGHDCCRRVPQRTQFNAVPIMVAPLRPVIVAAVYLATWHLAVVGTLHPLGVARLESPHPPESPPVNISILRV